MRVTLKAVNEKLATLGAKTELARGAGYFLFRGGDADEWIDRTVRVPTIGSLTLEQWVSEYKRLKTLNDDIMKAGKQAPPKPAKMQKQHHEAPARGAATHKVPPRDSTRKEPCSIKAKLLVDLDQEHKVLVAVEEQVVRAAREGKYPDLVTLSAAAATERGKFDRVLLAIRNHTLVHGC